MIFTPDVLRSSFQRNHIATLQELKQALQTTSTMTVFRRLKALGYRTSYSHRGKYYTLLHIPQFDERGLWSSGGVWFSLDGNLLATAQRFVEQSPAGVTASELQVVLHVEVKQTLLQLYQRKRVDRRDVGGVFIYFAQEGRRQREQRGRRQSQPAVPEIGQSAVARELSPELKAAILLFYSLLDEQQRRLYAGLESLKLGHGGDRQLADLLDLDPHTVARGRQQLLAQDVEVDRARKAGGGRKPVEKKRPK